MTKGPRRLGNLTIDKAFTTIAYTVGRPRRARRSLRGEHRRLERAAADRRQHDADRRRSRSARASGCAGRARTARRSKAGCSPPAGYDPAKGPYPLIVVSHGGPHAATGYSFDFKKQFFAANGYFVLDTNFRSSTGYGDAFKWATWGEWGKKDGEDVIAGIDYVIKRYPIDPKRVGHTGHSYGGFMTNWLITQYPDRFAAAITGAGHQQLDQRLRHGRHLPHEGDGVLRHAVG